MSSDFNEELTGNDATAAMVEQAMTKTVREWLGQKDTIAKLQADNARLERQLEMAKNEIARCGLAGTTLYEVLLVDSKCRVIFAGDDAQHERHKYYALGKAIDSLAATLPESERPTAPGRLAVVQAAVAYLKHVADEFDSYHSPPPSIQSAAAEPNNEAANAGDHVCMCGHKRINHLRPSDWEPDRCKLCPCGRFQRAKQVPYDIPGGSASEGGFTAPGSEEGQRDRDHQAMERIRSIGIRDGFNLQVQWIGILTESPKLYCQAYFRGPNRYEFENKPDPAAAIEAAYARIFAAPQAQEGTT